MLNGAAYCRSGLGDDLVAALVVTVLLLPQSLAYALLAGLPPVVGVMASLLPLVAYAAFGSSSTLAVGPVAVLALMTAQVIGPVAAVQGLEPHLVAMVLALEMAAVFLLAAWLRLDALAALLSAPVVHGFITGAVIVIAVGQMPGLLGLSVKGQDLAELLAASRQPGALQPHAGTAAMGLLALAALWALRRFGARATAALGLPQRPAQLALRMAPMAVVVVAMAWVVGAPAAAQGIALVGPVELRQGLSFPPVWQSPAALWWALLPPAALLGVVAYVESLAVAEALGARRGQSVEPRRELLGLAAANAAASVSGGMPVAGGFARSIVNFDAGARTRMAGVWTALFLLLAILALGDALRWLPKAVLAATIIVAVLSLIELKPFVQAWRYARPEFGLMLLVAVLTVVVGVEAALLAGVLVSAGLLLRRTAQPHWAEVGRLPGTEAFRNIKRFDAETLPGVLSIRIDESLLFTNARWLSRTLGAAPAQHAGLRHVVLMMSGVNAIDFSGLEALMHLARDLKAQQVDLHLSELKGPVADRLQSAGLGDWLTGRVFRTQHDAQQALAAAA